MTTIPEEVTTEPVDTAEEVTPEVTPEITPKEEKNNEEIVTEEKKLDNEEEKSTIDAIEDKWGDDFDINSLFEDLFKEEEKKEEEPIPDVKIEELTSTINELNSFLSEKDNAIAEKDKEITEIKEKYTNTEEKLNNAELVWNKLSENKALYDLANRFLKWEEIDLNKYVEDSLWEELDAINNSIDNSSDWEKPTWVTSLQERMMKTNAR